MAKSIFTAPFKYKTLTEGKILDPLIVLPVKTKLGYVDFEFLLDSGADTTMMPLSMAKKWDLYYNRRLKTQLVGIGEKRSYAYFGKVFLKIGGQELRVRCYFIDENDPIFLLGRLDIFDKFDITFSSTKKHIVFDSL